MIGSRRRGRIGKGHRSLHRNKLFADRQPM